MKDTRDLTFAAILLALSVILPFAFHSLGLPGEVILPMHFPVLFAGLLLGPKWGTIVGILAPAVNFAVSGRPPLSPPIMPMMVLELAAYGLLAGLAFRKWNLPAIPSLLISMFGGRVVLAAAAWLMVMVAGFKARPIPFVLSSASAGLIGIILQLVLLPPLLAVLGRSNLQTGQRGSISRK